MAQKQNTHKQSGYAQVIIIGIILAVLTVIEYFMGLYHVGATLLVVLIRVWGGLPEGVMYAILIMNAVTPLINRATQNRVYGH